jgi:hypothetical protein
MTRHVYELSDSYMTRLRDERELLQQRLEHFGAPGFNSYPTDDHLMLGPSLEAPGFTTTRLLIEAGERGLHHSVTTWPDHMASFQLKWTSAWFLLRRRGNTTHPFDGNVISMVLQPTNYVIVAEYGCNHDYHVSRTANCYREYTCSKCDHTYGEDSSG